MDAFDRCMRAKYRCPLAGLTLLMAVAISCTSCAAGRSGGVQSAKPKGVNSRTQAQVGPSLSDVAAGLTDFERRASKYSRDEWNFVLGYAHYRHGRYKEADLNLADLADKLPAIADHIIYYRAVTANALGRPQRAIEFLDALRAGHPDSVWSLDSKIARARALIALGRGREARKTLDELRLSRDGERGFDAGLLIARSLIEEGDVDGAAAHVKGMTVSAGGEAELARMGEMISEIKRRFHVDIGAWLDEPLQQYRLAESFFGRSQWDEAAGRLENILSHRRLPKGIEPEAKWLLARCLRSIHRYDEAIGLMEGLLGDPSASHLSESVMSTLATTYTKKNDYAKAIALRKGMMERSRPNSNAAAQMAYKIAFLYMDEGKYEEAIGLWQQALRMQSQARREGAEWYLAWCHYASGKIKGALAMMDGMLAKGKRLGIRDRLLYWKGRSLEKLGREKDARAAFGEVMSRHPGGYYAELAARRMKGDKREAKNFGMIFAGNPNASRRGSDLSAVPEHGAKVGAGHIGRAMIFDKLGLREEAARELKSSWLDESQGMLSLAARNFAHDVAYKFVEGRHHSALKGEPLSAGLPRAVWEAAYPMAYGPLVARLMKDGSIDPMLVWSIMRNESAFRPEVVSPAGAVGLMQLMPTTANRLAKEEGGGALDRRDLYRPAENIKWGAEYLKKLSRLFPGNQAAWIASYNAGEEAVGRWLRNGEKFDIEEWIEEIPYGETNLYVKKVFVSYWKYQRLYAH